MRTPKGFYLETCFYGTFSYSLRKSSVSSSSLTPVNHSNSVHISSLGSSSGSLFTVPSLYMSKLSVWPLWLQIQIILHLLSFRSAHSWSHPSSLLPREPQHLHLCHLQLCFLPSTVSKHYSIFTGLTTLVSQRLLHYTTHLTLFSTSSASWLPALLLSNWSWKWMWVCVCVCVSAVQLHAEACYAECQLQRAALTFLQVQY